MTPDDRWPDSLRLLLGPDSHDLTGRLIEAVGGRPVGCAPRRVTHRPGRSTVVRYDVRTTWPDGSSTVEQVVAQTGRDVPDDVVTMRDGDVEVALWRWPYDPALAGLTAALDVDRVRRLLAELGLGNRPVRLRTRAYRPTRRAVIEADNGGSRLFLKVVPPHEAEALHDTHRSLAAHVAVPDSIGWTGDGIVVLPAVEGRTLREMIRADEPVPDPGDIDALLDQLPTSLTDQPARPAWHRPVPRYADVLRATVPDVASQVDALERALADAVVHTRDHPIVPVHGDLHDAQLMVSDGRIVGMLDVDTAGCGHRIDDLANLCAHLSTLALVVPSPAPVRRYGAAVLARAEQTFDSADLRVRIAAAVLGLAAGPFTVLEPEWVANTEVRLGLAERWLQGAERVRGR